MHKTLSCATTAGLSEPENNAIEGVFHILEISRTRASSLHCFESYPTHSLKLPVYSVAPANLAAVNKDYLDLDFSIRIHRHMIWPSYWQT